MQVVLSVGIQSESRRGAPRHGTTKHKPRTELGSGLINLVSILDASALVLAGYWPAALECGTQPAGDQPHGLHQSSALVPTEDWDPSSMRTVSQERIIPSRWRTVRKTNRGESRAGECG
jgi:hypothetical protein